MSRSNNSRRGASNHHGRRHHVCQEGVSCPYCRNNFKHVVKKQRLKGTE